MLQDVGVRAKVGVLEPSQRSQLLRANTFPGLLLADPASTTYDTDGVLWRLRGPGGIIHQIWPGNYEGTPFYKLMEEARVTHGRRKRLKNYQEAAQIWHDEAPELFLFQGELIDAARNEVEVQGARRPAHHPVRHRLSLIRRRRRAPGVRRRPAPARPLACATTCSRSSGTR